MIIECQTCGCVYKINAENEEDDCPVTAELIECVMCFNGEAVCIETYKKTDRIPNKKTKEKIKLSEKASEIIKNNYENKTDKELVGLIKEELNEDYSYEQVKSRRKQMGFFKQRGNFLKGTRIKSAELRKKYTDEHFEWLRENIDKTKNNPELNKKFNKNFNMDISVPAMNCQMSINKIRRAKVYREPKEIEPIKLIDPHQKEIDEKAKTKRKGMLEEAVELIEDNYMEKTDEELRELIADKTGSFHQTDKIAKYRETNGMIRPRGWKPGEYVPEDEE